MKGHRFLLTFFCAILLIASLNVFAAEFPDVPQSHPNYEAIDFLSEEGVIAGYEDGSFIPEKEITRTEFCALVARTLGYRKDTYKAVELPFVDVKEGYWGMDYISFCYEKGLINGMGEGMFAPADKITFEQVIKIAVCMVGKQDEAMTVIGPKWYSGYLDIADEYDLLDRTAVVTGKSAPRSEVAQIVYNVISSDVFNAKDSDDESDENGEEEEKSELELFYEAKDFTDVKIILLDPGHNSHGKDIGARNDELELKEEEITWQIADKLRKKLEKMSYTVIMTREKQESSIGETSTLESLQARVDLSHEKLTDLYISIHCNMGGGNGIETYCFSKGGYAERLAKLIQKNVSKATDLYDRGVKTANFYVVKNTLMPAVLIETGFMDNEKDVEILTSKTGQNDIAEAIAEAVEKYDKMEPIVIEKNLKGSDEVEETRTTRSGGQPE